MTIPEEICTVPKVEIPVASTLSPAVTFKSCVDILVSVKLMLLPTAKSCPLPICVPPILIG